MFDIQVRKQIDPWLDCVAAMIVRMGLSANLITWLGFSLGIGGAICVAFQCYLASFALVLANRIFDGLDGMVARRTTSSDVGGFLDIALDMIFYSSVPFGFVLSEPQNAVPGAFLIFSFFGTGSSFLTYAIISAKRGQTTDTTGKKSFFYSVGLIEGTETATFLLAVCMFPSYFAISAWVFGALCWLTTLARISVATREFR